VADSVVLAVLDAEDPVRVGRYELLGVLGSGVMGRVFLGRSPGGRLAAVKVIHRGLAADHGFRKRFAREVSAARRVSGIFTVMVVDADVEAPQPWLATTYVAGPSLNQAIMDYGPMPAAPVMTLTFGLAEGLGAVHAARVVHRDLKPANVLLAPDGPRITDFGISRALADAALTDSGIAFGTPSFMSPEQGAGKVAGPSSDIFSLGSVLVYAATGRAPFGTGQASEIFYRILYDDPDISGVPAQIRPLIARCLAKDPALRPSADQIMAGASASSPEAGPSPAYLGKVLPQYDLSAFRGRGLASLAAPTQPIRAKIIPEASNIAGHAFISYVREDSRQVDWLQQNLEGAGIPVWRDTADLWPGEDWRAKIRRAITDNALVFIACFSQIGVSRHKSYQNEELTLAIEQMRLRPPDDPWLIPVRLDECGIPDREIGAGRTLASIQRADLFGDSANEGIERLMTAILRILG
jgi:serine/threonine protein kinase